MLTAKPKKGDCGWCGRNVSNSAIPCSEMSVTDRNRQFHAGGDAACVAQMKARPEVMKAINPLPPSP